MRWAAGAGLFDRAMKYITCIALAAALLSAGCRRSKPVVVGSKPEPEQALIGEIVAQHLEHRLDTKIQRRLGLGGSEVLYSALSSGDVTVYPEYTGTIASVILKETASSDPATVLERTRAEMLRVAQVELIGPMGFENPPVMVVRASSAQGAETLSDAAAGTTRWKIAVTFDFQQRSDGLPLLNEYHLPTGAPVRSLEQSRLFQELEKDVVTMIAVDAIDGHLGSSDWKVLADDKKVFKPQQACFLVRQNSLTQEPRLREALVELAGKMTQNALRKLTANVVMDKLPPATVAGDFLASVGLR